MDTVCSKREAQGQKKKCICCSVKMSVERVLTENVTNDFREGTDSILAVIKQLLAMALQIINMSRELV